MQLRIYCYVALCTFDIGENCYYLQYVDLVSRVTQ